MAIFGAARTRCLMICMSGAAACAGCIAPPRRAAFDAPFAVDRARAIVAAAEQQDAGAVHVLVSLLEDEDPAVRMYAALALRRLCGQSYGYRYYAPPLERAEAVRRWRDALRSGKVVVRGAARESAGP
ncbi:MAG: hypothetical protein D6744_01770, partial [Planctomycetota bacterium]